MLKTYSRSSEGRTYICLLKMRSRGTACAAQRWWIGCVLNTVISTVLFYSTLPKNVMFSMSPTSAWIVENFKVKWQVAIMTKWCYENLSHLSEPRLRILTRLYLGSIAKILQEPARTYQDLGMILQGLTVTHINNLLVAICFFFLSLTWH